MEPAIAWGKMPSAETATPNNINDYYRLWVKVLPKKHGVRSWHLSERVL